MTQNSDPRNTGIDLAVMQFMDEYAVRTNTHQFNAVAELIAEDATYWFSDGSFHGLAAIRHAFEETWAFIQNEIYQVRNVEWLVTDEHVAVCIYSFHWQGLVNGQLAQGSGRGTSVLRKTGTQWQVIHEHLSPTPTKSQM